MSYIDHLMTFIEHSVSPYHTVNHAISRLLAAGFAPLEFSEPWQLEMGKAYYCRMFSGELFAFKTGVEFDPHCGVRLAAAHTDWPCLRVKPAASYAKNGYLQANVETYGGLLAQTFFDRPLSIAGRLALKSDNLLKPEVRYIDIEKPIMVIPNLAIHMNRNVNEDGNNINPQVHLMPLLGIVEDVLNTDDYLLNFIAESIGVLPEDILDFELYVYNQEKPCFAGIKDSFISAPRLDDVTSVSAAIDGLIDAEPGSAMAMIALYDNEEVGNSTKQGARSSILMFLLEKIWSCFGRNHIQYIEDLHNSMILSADVAHGLHPNYPDKYDTTNQPVLGKGFCIKADSNQKYTWDSEAMGGIKQICMAYDIPYQMCVKRTGMAGGGTMGPLLSTKLPVKTVDVGVPILAMHSARELMGAKDQESLTEIIKYFLCV